MPTDRMMLRLPENLQRFLTYESARRGEAVSVIVRNAIAGSKEYTAWAKLDTEDEVRAKREQARLDRIAAQVAAKPERIFDIKQRKDAEWDCQFFRLPNGEKVTADWGAEHTWDSMIYWLRKEHRDAFNAYYTDPEGYDRKLRTLLATRERAYREADVELPELKPDLLKTAVPRCEHWVPLTQDCANCAEVANAEAYLAELEAEKDEVEASVNME